MTVSRRLRFFVAAVATIATVTLGQAAELKPFKLGISAPVSTVLSVWFAEASGIYARNGLKVETVSMEGGSRGTQVLLSGEIQAMHVGLSPVVQANAQGADLRAVVASANVMPMTVFTAKKSDPPLPKGTKFGISTFGSETDIAASGLLPKFGLKREDVEITQVGGSGQRYAALLAGRIDAAPLMEPATTQAKAKGLTPILDLSQAGSPWIFDAVVMTTPYIRDNRAAVLSFIKGYIEGAYWGLKHEDSAKEIIATRFKTKDKAVIDATFAEFKKLMPRDGKPSVEGAKNVIEQLAALGTKLKSREVDHYVDLSLIGELEGQGFYKKLNDTYGISPK